MTSTHASNKHISKMPVALSSVYFPVSTKPERFQMDKPVKGRNEPSAIGGVAWVVSRVKDVEMAELVQSAWRNTVELFGLAELES
jgi:TatD DNase family protein